MTLLSPPKAGYAYSPSGTPHLDPLKSEDRFVVWRGVPKDGGRFEKHAIHPETHRSKGYRYSKPENHLSYRRARAIAEGLIAETGGIYGVSFVPSRSGRFVFIDIDKVFDLVTGELLKPWAIDLAHEIGSYTEISPSRRGLRIIVYGVGDFTGHYHIEGYPLEHKVEVYNQGQHVSITENPYEGLDVPIGFAKDLLGRLDSTNPLRAKIKRERIERPEAELLGDLEEARARVKSVLVRLDIPTAPITEPGRHHTLIHYGSKVYATGNFTEEEFWQFLVAFNATMLYNERGKLEGLPEDELGQIYDFIVKLDVEEVISDKAILEALGAVLTTLNGMAPRMRSRPKNGEVGLTTTDRKTVQGLCLHGMKKQYARFLSEGVIRIYCSKGELLKMSRISDPRTSDRSLGRLSRLGVVTRGKEDAKPTGHFDVDLRLVGSRDLWIGDPSEGHPLETYALSPLPPSPCFGGINNKFSAEEVLKHLTFHHRGIGEVKKNVILATLELGGEAKSKEIAARMGRSSTDISGPLKQLCELGLLERVSYGRYRVVGDLERALYNARVDAKEFERDEKIEAANRQRTIRRDYFYDVVDAIEREESPASVKPPPGLHPKHIANIQANARAKVEERKREAEAISDWCTL